jgi:hypothetical protein
MSRKMWPLTLLHRGANGTIGLPSVLQHGRPVAYRSVAMVNVIAIYFQELSAMTESVTSIWVSLCMEMPS